MRFNRLAPDAEWEIWVQDTFDRESPRQVEIAGQGLVEGLTELWEHHLFETVQANGQPGFIHFNLWWKQQSLSIEVVGDWEGQVRLREWVYGIEGQTKGGYAKASDKALLNTIVITHKTQLMRGKTSQAILAAARDSQSPEAFMEKLVSLD